CVAPARTQRWPAGVRGQVRAGAGWFRMALSPPNHHGIPRGFVVTTDRTLARLLDAARALESESTVVQLGARALFEACPRGLGFAYTIRGHPARSVGAAILYADGREIRGVDLDRFRRVYGHAQLYYDRASVAPNQRGRWTDLPGDWFRHSPFYPIFRPYGRMGRALVCLGARPLACAGLLLPDDQRALSESE